MLRALPAMVRTAASSEAAVRSGSFALAMDSSCARVTLPTFSVFGRLEPEAMPTAFLRRTVAGVVLVMKVKVRSEYAVMITGVGRPGSSLLVAALNALKNSMMFRQRWPRAGPTGGLGLAWPALTCNLM